jgi:stage V sporulation protein D (sporulation-specific penicillin-binding protein)
LQQIQAAEGDTRTPEERRTARVQQVSKDIADLLSLEYDTVYNMLIDATSQYKVLAKQVDKPIADAVKEYANENSLPITISQDTKREYPFGAFAASVLGFMHGKLL